ncbi:MAG: T9SS type A sorting domain-containing protein [Ignavibacteriales bacterium]|nr:MAG: T9SS type A sorting domain-containing protein [Ignavibacteriales bacterium]
MLQFNYSFKMLFICTTILVFTSTQLYSQWTNDPSTNLTVCDTTGEQALAKIVSTSDGGTYVSWFDNRSGSYAVYLQRLDPMGNKLWSSNGLLVSNNPQSTSLVDYDLIADHNNNAVIVFTDTRNSGNLNVFAYMISPSGNFVWGANGVGLSSTSDFQANPKVAETLDGNFVFAWIVATSPTKIGLQKLSSTGVKQWGTDPILISSATEGFNYPAVVQSDSNAVLVFHTATTGSFPAQTVKLRVNKIQSTGTLSWGSSGMSIQDQGRIAAFTVPKVYSDKMNGGIIAWHDDRDQNNLQSAFVQRVSSAGTLYFPVDGAEASLMGSRHKFNPVATINPSTNETFIFWRETDNNQNFDGITGQKLSSNGSRLWTDNGKIFRDLLSATTDGLSSLNIQRGSDRTYMMYTKNNGSVVNQQVEAFACNDNGDYIWSGNTVTMSTVSSEKLQMVSTVDVFGNCKAVWGDRRTGAQGIYAQDINMNGQLGNPIVPVELVSFSASVVNDDVHLGWVTASETNNFCFDIERKQMASLQSTAGSELWEIIGNVAGNGTTTEVNSYSFVDNSVFPGKYQYRLKQFDFDGSFEYSNIIEVEINFINEFALEQNYPNPFNPSTTIYYTVADAYFASGVPVSLLVYDILGNEIATLVSDIQMPGAYKINFDAGNSLASGIYYCRLQAGSFSKTIKMNLIK